MKKRKIFVFFSVLFLAVWLFIYQANIRRHRNIVISHSNPYVEESFGKIFDPYNYKCHIPKLEAFSNYSLQFYDERMNLMKKHKTFDCKKIQGEKNFFDISLDRIEDKIRHVLILNIEVIKAYYNVKDPIECITVKFEKNENHLEIGSKSIKISNITLEFLEKENYAINLDDHGYYLIKCTGARKRIIYEDIYTILPLNMSNLTKPSIKIKMENVSQNPLYSDADLYNACEIPQSERIEADMNFLMIQIDSMSNNHFRRMFPLTFDYLNNSLADNMMFDNLLIVGEKTKPNTFPLLAGVLPGGIKELNITEEDQYYNKDYNSMPFIWKDFEELGDLTMFNEDLLKRGIFQNGFGGFRYSPTHYYTYPYWEKHRKDYKKFCINEKPYYEIYFDQIEKFISHVMNSIGKRRNFFAVNLLKMLTHDQFESPPAFDKNLMKFLDKLNEQGYFENTFLMINGDHGGRSYAYGEKAMREFADVEYPNPFLSIKLPKVLLNTDYHRNLMGNQKKLITAFDIHKTLKHFYYLKKNGLNKETPECRRLVSVFEPKIRGLRGISLFEDMPRNRSCSDALIPSSFCACMPKINIDGSRFATDTNKTIQEAVDFIYYEVIGKTSKFRKFCVEYTFHKLQYIKTYQYGNITYFEISIYVQPGNANFRASVNVANNKFVLSNEIVRVNKYGGQPNCLKGSDDLKPFCYCPKKPK